MIRIFVSYDPAEAIAYHVLNHSIQEHASVPVSVTPIKLNQLRSIHNRPRHNLASTEFSFTRFLTPYLCNYEGWALFMDCDMLVKADIAQLWSERDERFAVQVVKHNHRPKNTRKFLDQEHDVSGKQSVCVRFFIEFL